MLGSEFFRELHTKSPEPELTSIGVVSDYYMGLNNKKGVLAYITFIVTRTRPRPEYYWKLLGPWYYTCAPSRLILSTAKPVRRQEDSLVACSEDQIGSVLHHQE